MKRTYDYQWARMAKAHIRRQPQCVVCGHAAQHVDHIQPVKMAPWRRLDPANLQSLCASCHNRITVAYERGSVTGACDEAGNPLDPSHPWAMASNAEAIHAANVRPRPTMQVAAMLKRMAIREEGGGGLQK